jgi:hypothetical protein
MARGSHALRFVALVSAGALALHELRYRIGYGHEAEEAVAAQGHGYLSVAALGSALLAVAAACAFALAFRHGPVAPRSLGASWLSSSGALLLVYAVQEMAEGALSAGHPAGLAGVVSHGGWSALVLAAALGALISLALRGADEALALAAVAAPVPRLPRAPLAPAGPLARPAALLSSPLSRHLAGRAPPASC